MKLGLIPCLLLFFTIAESSAQTPGRSQAALNGAYAEFYVVRPDFSNGFISLNYERALGKRRRMNGRIGFWPDFESTLSFPLTLSWITGPHKRHHLEYGIGAIFRIEHYVDPYDPSPMKTWFYDLPALMVPFMYRYQTSSGWYFRGGINVFLSWPTLPSPSLSLGYRF